MRAKTTINITCSALGFSIPAGVEFTILSIGDVYSICEGLGITLIWNYEFELIEGGIYLDPSIA